MSTITRVATRSPYEAMGCYSRAVAVGDWIFVSNTAGRHPETGEIPEDVREQTVQVFANIQRALRAVGAGLADVLVARIFVQEPKDVPVVMGVVGETFRGIRPAATVTCPPLGGTIYKVEIEVTALRGASAMTVETVTV
ncbi:Rid family hydrolase [Gluconacetobacter sacchari]|uniref:Rid family hydrolase n=1 Tax=Gluconacetobacter sacchari TaxID=92759 RepID=UPI0039B45F56